jgi:Cu/Ag efflux pump CusA
VALVLVPVPVFLGLGTEFMPPLDEGSLLYMPSTMPVISIGKAQKLLQIIDRIIQRLPEADRILEKAGVWKPGYVYLWSGQYETMQRVKQRLLLVVPLTLFLIFLLLYLNTRSVTKTLIVLLAVPFSAIGAT